MKRTKTIAVLAGLTFVAGAAFAHDDAWLDTQKAPNGGQLRMAGPYHLELVLVRDATVEKENPVLVFVTDHADAKIPTAGAKGSATILSGKLKTTVTLQSDGDNRLKGMAKYAATPDTKAVVSVTFAGKPPEQARFTPLAAAKGTHTDHKH